MLSNIQEEDLSKILGEYEMNPIILWEIILRQQYDKIFKFDDDTILYNIRIIKEFQ